MGKEWPLPLPIPSTLLPDPDDVPPRAEVEAALSRWRAAHPPATLAAIEPAGAQQLRAYRAALITATAGVAPPGARPCCPEWGPPLQRGGPRSRHRRTAHGGELTGTAPAWRCAAGGAGLFPPD